MTKHAQLEPMEHKAVIEKIVSLNHGALTRGFHKKAWGWVHASDPELCEEDEVDAAWFRKVMPLNPDAYAIEPWNRKIILFEVEITSRLTPRKLTVVADFALHMILLGWQVTLIRVDEYGRFRKEPLEPFVPVPSWKNPFSRDQIQKFLA